ncbi:MAG: sensor histidine kinase [Solirubrobacterales bacterium]|nr:sensor histidine kinase [Solirubrobacterales bacterium]
MAAAFLLGSLRDPARARLGLAVVLGGAVVIATQLPDHSAGDVVAVPAIFAVAWLAGTAQRQRAEQAEAAEERAARAEREREAAARLAVAEERVRIARELHDIVAHAVSVMVLQTGAVRHRLPPEGEDAAALRQVEETGRGAMAEMRKLLGALRRPDEDAELAPQPGLGRLGELVDEVRRAGLDVELRVDGPAAGLPEAVDVSAYRIVQEGLTNTLKHAHASHADVHVRCDEHEVRIEVRDDGAGDRGGAGHGLVGVRERVAVYGGDLHAGTAEGGGFALTARLPLDGLRA